MKIRLLSVGKPRDAALVSLHDRYAERIAHFGVRYESSWVPETRPGPAYSDEQGAGTVVALDPGGRALSSAELAQALEVWSTPCLTLIVGGPLGLHRSVLSAADLSWSLSLLTFPHEIVRVLVVEQLYRALTILRNTPYHR